MLLSWCVITEKLLKVYLSTALIDWNDKVNCHLYISIYLFIEKTRPIVICIFPLIDWLIDWQGQLSFIYSFVRLFVFLGSSYLRNCFHYTCLNWHVSQSILSSVKRKWVHVNGRESTATHLNSTDCVMTYASLLHDHTLIWGAVHTDRRVESKQVSKGLLVL